MRPNDLPELEAQLESWGFKKAGALASHLPGYASGQRWYKAGGHCVVIWRAERMGAGVNAGDITCDVFVGIDSSTVDKAIAGIARSLR